MLTVLTSGLGDYLPWQNLLFRLGIALLAGAIVGLEREIRHKSAGLRTHMLVSFSTAFLILISIQLGMGQDDANAISRVLQGIVTGVGFLGGGVILRSSSPANGDRVRAHGLTTAATIWLSAALGIAAGCGLWGMALLGAGVSWLILEVVKKAEKRHLME